MSRPWAVFVALVAGLGVLAGVIALGKFFGDDLERRGHYTLVVTDLRVPAPPGMTRELFLAEVCYESRLPERLDRRDPATPARLKAAFERHPWVESATVDLAGAEPVKLVFRKSKRTTESQRTPS